MAAVPAALRKADIARFAQRAGQLEKAKPTVAYWCNYWIVEQILSKGLQNEDEESMTYSINLMDKLEKMKAELSENDAVSDDMASQAYIEQFGSETFQRAENAMNANRASRQTADTFSAAATFLDLRQIWGPLDPETTSKIKYAKYHALRIAKALKAGEDPNLSNPAPESLPNHEDQVLSHTDPDVRMVDGSPSLEESQYRPGQPTIEEVTDKDDRVQRNMAHSSALNQSLHPSRANSSQRYPNGEDVRRAPEMPSPQGPGENYYHNPSAGDVSPIVSPTTGSEGDGYFPAVPDVDTRIPASSLPQVPPENSLAHSLLPQSPPASSILQRYPANSSLHSFPPPPVDRASAPPEMPPPNPNQNQQTPAPFRRPNVPMQPSPGQNLPVSARISAQPSAAQSIDDPANYITDEEAILKAQKHARLAISALNFEDVKTAVKELRGALDSLGA